MEENPTRVQRLIVWWVLWAAFLVGSAVQFHFLGAERPGRAPDGPDTLPWQIGLIPIAVSIVIRWGVLPRMKQEQPALVCMIIGIAFAEAAMFFGIFLFPSMKYPLFAAALFGIAQFIPLYASRLIPPDGAPAPGPGGPQ